MAYEYYNLSEWPFRTSADENYSSVWAGRAKTKEQLDRLLRKIALIPKSGLHVFWANFGMGKTHTLYYLKHNCSKTGGQIIPIYAVMPKRSTGFLELYREIVQAFLSPEMRDYLGRQLVDLGQNSKGASVALHPMFSRSPGIVKALLTIRNGDIEATTAAMQWLTAQPGLDSRSLNALGLTYRIKTPEDAINALSALINLAVWAGKQQKQLLLMIDEFQRVGELRQNIVSQVNSSLHTVFNAHPVGLQILLTFSCGKKENVDYLLSAELKSRAEPQSIMLDVLKTEEGTEFLADLLSSFRITSNDEKIFYPFTRESALALMNYISSKKVLTPRRIMLYSGHLLEQYILDHDVPENGIGFSEFNPYLNDPNLGSLDIDSPVN